MSTSSSLPNPYDAEHWGQWSVLEQTMLNQFQDLRDSQDKTMFTDDARSSLKETITKLDNKSQSLNERAVSDSLDVGTVFSMLPAFVANNSVVFMTQMIEHLYRNPSMIDATVMPARKRSDTASSKVLSMAMRLPTWIAVLTS
ncbi:hypothetical protein JCM24511_00090 [Saitozyma sp. JCM 24511]|nr:hypothetical protein JCM24511_00090 [Saitozyma sp. JCM 24511]